MCVGIVIFIFVIDCMWFNVNIDVFMSYLLEGMGYCVVVKLLLLRVFIEYVCERFGMDWLMIFNLLMFFELSEMMLEVS